MRDFAGTDLLMKEALERGVFPGAVLLVSLTGEVVLRKAYGYSAVLPELRPMSEETLFDLASLTKPLATAVALMVLAAENRIGLDQRVEDFFSLNKDDSKSAITVRHLLSHSSGLPAYRPFYKRLRFRSGDERKRILRKWLLAEPLLADPGETAVYSDLGFMILEWIVERASGVTLDRFVSGKIYGPAEFKSICFRPLERPAADLQVIAATENCPWRKRILYGEVHDDNAYIVGGVSGHAGLFGTADDVHALVTLLRNACFGEESVFLPEIVQSFFVRQSMPKGATWALGFDTPSEEGSSAGKYFSRNTVGHLGFTGVSFWMDLEKEITIVLLTNRVHPSRQNEQIRVFRPRVHDAIMEELSAC
ncbi:MAG: serine hydrolase domain-containing protein [Pseudomonadota bacterium]